MENIDPVELSRQLKKPSGEVGSKVANKLNESNQKLYELGWDMVGNSKGIGNRVRQWQAPVSLL